MNHSVSSVSIDEYKIQASLLLKSLQANDTSKRNMAIQQLKVVPQLAQLSSEAIQHQAKRKHALAAIACKHGFGSWQALREHCEYQNSQPFVRNYVGGHLNKWFATYEEAKAEQQVAGGFLFPYKKQYFICDQHFVRQMGLDAGDADWQAIGFDWVKPLSIKAWQRLNRQWLMIRKGQ